MKTDKYIDYFKEAPFQNPPWKGLYLVNNNTGTGKSHATIEGMTRWALDPGFPRGQIYASGIWSNIPVQGFHKAFVAHKRGHEFGLRVLVLKSALDCFLEHWDEKDLNLPEALKTGTGSLSYFVSRARQQSQANSSKDLEESLREHLDDEIAKFRKALIKWLNARYAKLPEIFEFIRPGGEGEWVSRLFPASRLLDPEVRITLLTVDMLKRAVSVVVRPGVIDLLNEFVPGKVLFLDEFDDVKSRWLQALLEESWQNAIELIHAGENAARLFSKTLPAPHVVEKNPKLKEFFSELQQEASEIMTRWHLERDVKLATEQRGKFLFKEHAGGRRIGLKNLWVDFSEPSRVWLREANEDSHAEPRVHTMLSDLRTFFIRVIRFSEWVARAEGTLEDFDHNFSSVLKHFHFNETEVDYAFRLIRAPNSQNSRNEEEPLLENLFFQKGFSLNSFEDHPSHRYQTEIRLYDLLTTPEQLLAQAAQNAFVVGLSATATLPTVLKNFDHSYLRFLLQQDFLEPSSVDLEQRVQDYHKVIHWRRSQANYQAFAIDSLDPQGGDDRLVDELMTEAAVPRTHVEAAVARLREISIDQGDYEWRRYSRFLRLLLRFQSQTSIHGLLAFFNVRADRFREVWDQRVLMDLAVILGFNEAQNHEAPVLYFLRNEDLQKGAHEVKALLRQGIRVLLLTTYATSGLGVNLQYEVENLADVLRELGDLSEALHVDLNAIYLDKPTQIVPKVQFKPNEPPTVKDLLAELTSYYYLYEAGEISQKKKYQGIEGAFSRSLGMKTTVPPLKTSRLPSVRYGALRTVLQALGRLFRVRDTTRREVFVFYDTELASVLTKAPLPTDMQPLPLYEALLNSLQEGSQKPDPQEELVKRLEGAAANGQQLLESVLYRNVRAGWGWSEADVRFWLGLRHQVLTAPVSASSDERPEVFRRFFLDLTQIDFSANRYRFEQLEDFKVQHLDFFDRPETRDWSEVSEQACQLPDLMRIPELRRGFEDKGYATAWGQGSSWMSPGLFNNIYKGALGEAVLQILAAHFLKLSLEPLGQQHFERFDWEGPSGVFWDSKYHQFLKSSSPEEFLKDVNAVGVKQVFIVRTAPAPEGDGPFAEIWSLDPRITIIHRLINHGSAGPRLDERVWPYLTQRLGDLS